MKHVRYMFVALLLCLGIGTRAANIITISSTEGVPGEEVTVSIGLQNSDAVSSLQLSIPLDDNLMFVSGSAIVGSRCASHTGNIGVDNGTLQIVVYSLSMATIAPGNGDVVSFKLRLGNEPISTMLQPSKTVLTDGNGNSVTASCDSGTVTIRCAKAQFNTDEIDFGRVPIRSTYTNEVAVTNVGNADLVVSNLLFSDVNLFSSNTQLPITITPGATASLNVTFAPTDRGTVERQLRIVTNSVTQNRAIRLKAQPYAVNELHIGDASGVSDEEVTITMHMNNMDDISGYQLDFVLPNSLQYVDGSFAINDNRKQDHTGIASMVDGTLKVVVYSPSGKPLIGNDGEIGSFRVKIVGRNSVALKPVKTVLTATINNKVENVVSDVYAGWVTVLYPAISTNTIINFGAVPITEECEKVFSIKNNGKAPLTVSRIVFNNEHLSISEDMPLEIPRNGSKNVTVIYNSIEETAFEAKMQIYSNDPERRLHEIKVIGSRFAPNYLGIRTPDVFIDGELKVELSLNTYDEITGLQFDLEYPNSIYKPFDNNVQTMGRAEGMSVISQQISNNTIRYVCFFLTGGSVAAGEGDIMTLIFKPVAETVPEGTYSINIKNVKLGNSALKDRYSGNDLHSSFSVKQHNPVTITAISYTRQYGEANPTFDYSSEGATVVGKPVFSCEATATSPVGEYPIVISKGSVENDEVTFVNGTLTITKAPLNIAADTYTKKQGEVMPEFTLAYTGFKNNETKDVLMKQPVVTCDATESSAPGEYPVTVSGAEAQNYDISYTNGKLIVADADAIIIKAKSYSREYGEVNPTFDFVTEGANLEGLPEITCEATATSPVGTYDIIVKQGSITNYNVTYVAGTLTITKAPLNIEVGTYIKKQGDAIPEFELTYTGFKNNETKDVLMKLPVIICNATESSAPGEYPIIVSGAEAQNYDISYTNGKLLVNEADLVTIKAMSYSREYGEANPAFEYTTEGAALEGMPEITCAATATSPVGTYDIIVKQGSITNYNVAYVAGTLTITKAPLNIAARTYTKKQGEAMPEFTLTYTGFKNNETKDVLTKQPVMTCEATIESAPGEYPIIVGSAETRNYDISYTNGKLIVLDADAVIVKVKSYSREYGEANPVFEYIVEGAALDGMPEIICEATLTSPIGEYPIVIKKGSVKNYNDTYINGTLTITKALLNASVGNYSRKQGQDNPEFAISYSGWKNNENESVLLKKPVAKTEATKDSPVGEYAITISGGEAQNYDFEYVGGTLTVTMFSGIEALLVSGKPFDVYTTSGVKVKSQVTTLKGLPRGVYIINKMKVFVR